MPFKDSEEGQTHYFGDGCPEHPKKNKYGFRTQPVLIRKEKDLIVEFIRDITSVAHMSKSEARKRLNEVLSSQTEEYKKVVKEMKIKTRSKLGFNSNHFITGHNQAIRDTLKTLENL